MTDPIIINREDLRELIQEAVRVELSAVGLRTDDAASTEATRDDLRFARRLRLTMDGIASKIGMAVITVFVAATSLAVWEGFKLLSKVTPK